MFTWGSAHTALATYSTIHLREDSGEDELVPIYFFSDL